VFTKSRYWSWYWITCMNSKTARPVPLRYVLISSHLCQSFPSGLSLCLSFFLGFSTKIFTRVSSALYMSDAPHLTFVLIWSPQWCPENYTNRNFPQSAIWLVRVCIYRMFRVECVKVCQIWTCYFMSLLCKKCQ